MRQSVISNSTGCSKFYNNKVQLQLTRKVKVDCKKNSEHKREKCMKIKTNLNCVQNISVYISNHASNPRVCPFLIRRRDFSVISELSSSLPVSLYVIILVSQSQHVEVIRALLSAIIFSSVSQKCWGEYWNVAELSAKPLSWNRN